jgi:hypothetical protein
MDRYKTAIVVVLVTIIGLFAAANFIPSNYDYPEITTTYTAPYVSKVKLEPQLEELQCPIPMECRVRNYTGTQCVFSSLEMLARWAECKKLLEPEPLTSRSGCRSYSGPSHAAGILDKYGVKYENIYRDQDEAIALIKKAMTEGRGCLFGVPGHAMVLVHYDEKADKVCWVDNSDRSLKVQTMTVSQFKRKWDSWVVVIYADPDVVPYKVGNFARQIPIRDRSGPQRQYPKDFIPMPYQ